MFLENFKSFIKFYAKGRYLKLAGFTIMSFFAGCLEFIGIALIYPFIMLIIQPELVGTYIKIDNTLTTGLLLGLAILLIFVLKNAYMIVSLYIQSRFVTNWKQDLMIGFMRYYLYAPYKETMVISQSDKIYTMETLVNQVIDNFVLRILNLFTNIIIIFMVILLLIIKFPLPALVTIIFVCVALVMQNKYFKSRTSSIAELMAQKFRIYQKSLLQNLNNIKEIKILSAENMFYRDYVDSSRLLKNVQVLNSFYCAIPPYIVEILVVVSLIIMAYVLANQGLANNSELVASFAIVVAALFRVAPALNRIQSSIIAINASRNFVKLLNEEQSKYNYTVSEEISDDVEKIEFKDKIKIKNVRFAYKDNKNVIDNVSFEIKKGDFVGIVGLSGAGKSTLVDILTGLLPVDSGEIRIDDVELTSKNYRQFRKLLGYVPQQINILDKSIRENVAFGSDKIDDKKVINCLKKSQLFDVIEEHGGINSNIVVGSNGLSQGQKQRLAIARALYREPEILILDEATSALDVQVEAEITKVLAELASKMTIIAIAHRLSTLKYCNKLIYMQDGKIVDIGTFGELSSKYDEFENLVKLSNI